MSNNSNSTLSLRIRLARGYIGGGVPVALRISLRCDDGTTPDVTIDEIESEGNAAEDGDIVIDIMEALPAMHSLLREERRFLHAVASGLLKNITIDDMADACCLSVSTFKRRFRMRYSASPHKWLLSQRLKIAHTLILTTTMSVSSLAAICGFRNASHFIAQFRRRYSTTPMQLRDGTTPTNEDNIIIDIEI